ncbi:MAG: hypothetical protein OXC79_12000, partial [Candidatus Poribacteria bacterium]|nr:hypothetical protein [Candidatus Poribacteria bacterium]
RFGWETEPTGPGTEAGLKRFLKSSRFLRRIRFGWETEPTGPGTEAGLKRFPKSSRFLRRIRFGMLHPFIINDPIWDRKGCIKREISVLLRFYSL